MPSFKVEVIADDSGQWVGNDLRFGTREGAEADARDIKERWYAVRETRVVESEDPVNVDWEWVEDDDGDFERVKIAIVQDPNRKVN